MAIHDLWSYDNAPIGTNLVQAALADQTKVTNNTTNPYNYYTQLPGCVMNNVGTGTPTAVSSDGFLNFTRTSSGTSNPMWFQLNQVFNFTGITRWAFGFRTKCSAVTASNSAIRIFTTANGWNGSLAGTLITEGDVAAPANTEVYVEGVVDLTAGTFSVYVNGALTRTVACTAANWASALYVMVDTGGSAGVASSVRGYRDFYFLDLDNVDTTRLGPIRSAPASLSNISGSEWTLNSAADLPTAMTTALQNPPVSTPSASSPVDLQAMTAMLNTAVPAGTQIIAIQPQLTVSGDSAQNQLDISLKQSINTMDVGTVTLTPSAIQYNQRWGIQRVAPDGGVWTPAKINATQAVLTPGFVPATVMLLHFDEGSASSTTVDVMGHPMTLVNSTLAATARKFGVTGYQGASSGTGLLYTSDSPNLEFTGDFTMECWWLPTTGEASNSNESIVFSKGGGSYLDYFNGAWYMSLGETNTKIWNGVAAGTLVANTWTHVAFTRKGTALTLWINGVSVATATSSLAFGVDTSPFIVGNYTSQTLGVKGGLDEVRISNVARYQSTFTPPVTAFGPDNVTLASVFASTQLNSTKVPSSATTTTALLASIMADAGVNLVPEDIVNAAVPVNATTVTLTVASTTSHYVVGGTVTLTFAARVNTSMLLHFDGTAGTNTVTDTNGHPVTVTGTPALSSTQSKFGGTAMYFDGSTSGYLSTPDKSDLELTGDFTIEWWQYLTSLSFDRSIVNKGVVIGSPTNPARAWIEFNSGAIQVKQDGAASATVAAAAGSSGLVVNTWQHIALSKQGSTWGMYVNGVLVGSATITGTFGVNAGPLTIGTDSNGQSLPAFYMDEFRISTVPRYLSTFTPPPKPFTADGVTLASVFSSTTMTSVYVPSAATTVRAMVGSIVTGAGVNLVPEDVVDGPVAAGATTITLTASSGSFTYAPGSTVTLTLATRAATAMLMHFDGANGATTTTEAKGHAVAITGAGALSTTQSKFGGSSYAPNSTGNVKVTDTGDLATPGDFTVEFFVYWTSIPSTGFLVCKNSAGSTQAAILIISGNLTIGMDDASGPAPLATSNLVTGQWNHIAYSKSGTTIRLFVNGVLKVTATTSQSWGNNSLPMVVGSNGTGGNATPGYIDELRVSNVARYISAFTPPVKAFTTADGASIASVFASTTLTSTFVPAADTTTTALIAAIMADSNVNLVPEDIVSAAVTANSSTVTLTAAPTSVNFAPGSTVTLTFATKPKTVMLMHLDGTAGSTTYTDAITRTWTNNGNGSIQTAQSKFGGASYQPNSSGYASTPADASLVLSAGFTVEFWAYRTAALGDTTIFSCKTANDSTHQTTIGQQSDKGLGIYLTDGAGWKSLAPASAFPLNQWNHCAVVYLNGVYTGYINGVAQGTLTSALGFGLTGGTYTLGGNSYNTASQFPGYLDELRVSNMARYTANFTPPSAAFTLD